MVQVLNMSYWIFEVTFSDTDKSGKTNFIIIKNQILALHLDEKYKYILVWGDKWWGSSQSIKKKQGTEGVSKLGPPIPSPPSSERWFKWRARVSRALINFGSNGRQNQN